MMLNCHALHFDRLPAKWLGLSVRSNRPVTTIRAEDVGMNLNQGSGVT